ncbi:mannose-6-phosphate isomerase type II [Flexistipes sinusarabici DSM 4947]|uniref:Mannose-6-phosphate isomerase type II n=2 Tax=Flexistipes sinusarabici TaxID=2352 RepID=F8E430_FLESM|nr:mannose-6-phosphate isomerase type II [Flexistipes sinusarabici DSM 4947]HCW94017.1 cupin domain-containing protein [Flexistipes sinusarabici]
MNQKAFYTENRPWGSFTVIDSGEKYKLKRIEVLPHKRLSLQKHMFRDEYWTIIQGKGEVQIEDAVIEAGPGKMYHIPRESRHRISNKSNIKLIFFEVQMGDKLEENDIIRYEDDYGRIKNG